MPNVRRRTGAQGTLSTREPAAGSESVANNVSQRGKYSGSNEAKSIDNSVAVQPKNVGLSKVDCAVSWPGKFSY